MKRCGCPERSAFIIKTLIMAAALFKKHAVLNIILIIELAAVTLVAVISSNMVRASTYCIDTFKNSPDRILYCVNKQSFMRETDGTYDEDAAQNRAFLESMKKLKNDYPFIKGISEITSSGVIFNKDAALGGRSAKITEVSDLITVDDETARAVQYPLEAGAWFGIKKSSGCVPCVIGGTFSERYKIGQKISGYVYSNKIGDGKNIKKIDFTVTGRLMKPEGVLTTACGSNGRDYTSSSLFESKLDSPLIMIAPASLTGRTAPLGVDSGNVYVFLDKLSTDAEILSLRNKLSYDYTFLDSEFIANENKQLAQNISIDMPFIIMLLLVALCGIVSMCMLTTLKNLEIFKIYYLTGCPRWRTVLVTWLYSLYYYLGSAIVFFAADTYLYNHIDTLLTKSYFIIYPKMLLFISLGVAAVCMLSFVIPFFILKRQKTVDLLRVN